MSTEDVPASAEGCAGNDADQHVARPIHWDRSGIVLAVAANRSLESVLRRAFGEDAEWVVIVRSLPESAEVYYYAFRSIELQILADQLPDRLGWPIAQAMDMHEWKVSGTARGGRVITPPSRNAGPASERIVGFDSLGQVAAIGEPAEMAPRPSTTYFNYELGIDYDLGPLRGVDVSARPEAPPAAEIEVTLSAEAPSEIAVEATAKVLFQIDLSAEAAPLAESHAVTAKPDVPIMVAISVENDAIDIVRNREYRVDSPKPGEPRTGFFTVKGMRPGVSRLAVIFRQGGSDLGNIGLAMEVVREGASGEKTKSAIAAAPRDIADDEMLLLTVQQVRDGDKVFYEYLLHSEKLGLVVNRLRSNPLLDRGGGLAATELAFVGRIYDIVTRDLPSTGAPLREALGELQREVRALGASLCRELFEPDVAKVLWRLRKRITLIQVVSWEPYIPWELVRLRDPESDEIDDCFLCEYGLVRTFAGEAPPRALSMERWSYLGSIFPTGLLRNVGSELAYFTEMSPESLRGHGITPRAIPATRDGFYDALAEGDFDVLHISCHAVSPHESIERSCLIIGEEQLPGETKARLIDIDTMTVETEARLKKRRPLVFLNACETGHIGAVLTAWGGWPNVFLRKGAGAFVGSSWAVRDKPAAAFSTAFYNALLDGKTLTEAASAARAAAKKFGDASWLAFKVYGHPHACRVPVPARRDAGG
ncbi:CHAT domain-containing protein [Herbaspirillum sp. ST 5-3]|uniref:CHAT domain-containing protein n=1 Tax=Oxalobacteraceae TaxID=75682 RepID=UPI0010A5470B|nr:CHAT domain-containing protein [Herbaspirillum sp. ST 5-3]